jgi:2-polyprenyl-3-methyl-5-hydroxy-6-metoxy-1,4-benzoquinol methylase
MDERKIIAREKKWKMNFPKVYEALNFHKYLQNSSSHLDFGCGMGIFAYSLAKRHPKTLFVGTDKDAELLTFAKNKYILPNLNFENENERKTYDTISAIFVIHHIENYKKTLHELHNRLPRGGILLVMEFQKTPKKKFMELYKSEEHAEPFELYYKTHNRWSKKEFESECKSVGFETVSLEDFGEFLFSYVGKKK